MPLPPCECCVNRCAVWHDQSSSVHFVTVGVTQVVKVGPKGRVVIPRTVRDQLDISEGDELVVVVDRDTVRLVPRGGVVASLRGALADTELDVVAELLAERRAAAAAER